MNPWITAFVDETGTNDLGTDNPVVSNLFICVAVIVDDAGLAATSTEMRRISADLCSGAEITSRRVGSDHKRRLRFLERIRDLPFGYFALVINKDRIPDDSGLAFKPSFYKFINRMLYGRIRGGCNLRVIADEIGGAEFMQSFKPYLHKHGFPNLFQEWDHSFAKSQDEPLIQLADFIAGTLAYCFDPNKRGEHSTAFREVLRTKEAAIVCWPWQPAALAAIQNVNQEIDALLESRLTARVAAFLDEHQESPHEDRTMQVHTLSELLFARQFEDREKQAVVSDRLMEHLRKAGFGEISKQAFQSRVIGKIRDDGVILAGSSDGYRLALSIADISDYLSHDKAIIEPMLSRILKARGSVLIDTAQKHDILAEQNFLYLNQIVRTFQDAQLLDSTARD